MLLGSMVAVVTPMDPNGAINYSDLGKLVDFHFRSGTHALIVAGTTGESATLDHEEHIALLEHACELAAGRIPIIAGTGSNSTRQTLELSKAVDQLPIVAFLVVTPYYNKPTQEGMRRHFSTVADAVRHPLILYNVPGRTGVDLKPETVVKLASHSNIHGIKEATGELARVHVLREECGPGFSLLSGDDETACEFMLQGGNGVISVTANVAPVGMRRLCDAAIAGKRADAEGIDSGLRGLHQTLFVESNPIPVKWALEKMGMIGPGIRLPLTPLAARYHDTVLAAMAAAGIKLPAN
ncbi:MAG TPA: 4-hydroxy-tetrahydrodipicolinate synthase [Gammaproteobacteria bacterium]|nr:4-hydroxy-tetrahydrodipicolinate synthase [Gammaproteobacteria bacterium]